MPTAIVYWLILIGLCLILGTAAVYTHCQIHHEKACSVFHSLSHRH